GDVSEVAERDFDRGTFLVSRQQGEPFIPAFVGGDRDQAAAVAQPVQQSIAHSVSGAEPVDGTAPRFQGERFAAGDQSQGAAVRTQRRAVEVVGGRYEPAGAQSSVGGEGNRDVAGLAVFIMVTIRGVDQEQLGTRVVDEAAAVRGEVARIELGMRAVPGQAGAVRVAGVDVRDAVVVAEEVDPIAYPAGVGQVAGQADQGLVVAAVRAVDPEPSAGAAAIALPARGFGDAATEHGAAVRAPGDAAGRSVAEQSGGTAGWIDREQPVPESGRLLCGAGIDDLAGPRVPSDDGATGRLVGQALSGP